MKMVSAARLTPSGAVKVTSTSMVVPAPVHAAIRQLAGQSSPSSVFPSSQVSPASKSTTWFPHPAGDVGVAVAVPADDVVGDGVFVGSGGIAGVSVCAGVAVGLFAAGQPFSALFTPVISSLTVTSPFPSASKIGQPDNDAVPNAMLTPT